MIAPDDISPTTLHQGHISALMAVDTFAELMVA
jgi:hypothetical protein